MKPLHLYIEYLLKTRHYAFVPGLGGFMYQEIASSVMRDGQIAPPFRLLKFNRFMDHDDGMLANVVMKAEGVTYDEATLAIRFAVSDLLKKVQQEGRYPLGHIGHIFFDDECHISFIAADQTSNDPLYFGFGRIQPRRWQEVERERAAAQAPRKGDAGKQPAPEKPKVTPKPTFKAHDGIVEMPTRWLRRAAVILLVVSFIIANMIPWSNTHEGMHFANLVDTGSLLRRLNIIESATVADLTDTTSLVAATDTSSVVTDTISNQVKCDSLPILEKELNVPQKLEQASVQPKATPKAPKEAITAYYQPSQKEYLLVVASCTSQKEAERAIRRLLRKGLTDLEVYEKNGRYRVFIRQFDVKKEAVEYLEQFRSTTQFKDAWLLVVRPNSSLSYNKKIEDNDQLSMELSHINRPAERDQG